MRNETQKKLVANSTSCREFSQRKGGGGIVLNQETGVPRSGTC